MTTPHHESTTLEDGNLFVVLHDLDRGQESIAELKQLGDAIVADQDRIYAVVVDCHVVQTIADEVWPVLIELANCIRNCRIRLISFGLPSDLRRDFRDRMPRSAELAVDRTESLWLLSNTFNPEFEEKIRPCHPDEWAWAMKHSIPAEEFLRAVDAAFGG